MATKTRFIVEWTTRAAVESACRDLGMKDGDGTSFGDWVDLGAFVGRLVFSTFRRAVAEARDRADYDVWGSPRIERQRLVANHDDRGVSVPGSSWETDASWEWDPSRTLSERAPHALAGGA